MSEELNVCQNVAFLHVAQDAVMSIPKGELEWICRYGNIVSVRYLAAGCLESYSYLMSDDIPQKEAFRRLRLLRKAKKRLRSEPAGKETK